MSVPCDCCSAIAIVSRVARRWRPPKGSSERGIERGSCQRRPRQRWYPEAGLEHIVVPDRSSTCDFRETRRAACRAERPVDESKQLPVVRKDGHMRCCQLDELPDQTASDSGAGVANRIAIGIVESSSRAKMTVPRPSAPS